jgi:lysophospholipid acyltransferase (LPLAT)-like uncharacterized protein
MRKFEVTPFGFSFTTVVEAKSKKEALDKFVGDMKNSFKWRHLAWERFLIDMPMANVKMVMGKKKGKED